MSMEVTDKAGKDVYKPEKPAEREEVLPLGGTRLPARAFVILKPDQEPGTYTCKVTVTDNASKATKVLEKTVRSRAQDVWHCVPVHDERSRTAIAGAADRRRRPESVHPMSRWSASAAAPTRSRTRKSNCACTTKPRRPTLAKPISAAVPEGSRRRRSGPVPLPDPVQPRRQLHGRAEGHRQRDRQDLDDVRSRSRSRGDKSFDPGPIRPTVRWDETLDEHAAARQNGSPSSARWPRTTRTTSWAISGSASC